MASAAILPLLSGCARRRRSREGPGRTAPLIARDFVHQSVQGRNVHVGVGIDEARKGCVATLAARLHAAPNPILPPASMYVVSGRV